VWCSLWGTDWILKYYLDELRLQRVDQWMCNVEKLRNMDMNSVLTSAKQWCVCYFGPHLFLLLYRAFGLNLGAWFSNMMFFRRLNDKDSLIFCSRCLHTWAAPLTVLVVWYTRNEYRIHLAVNILKCTVSRGIETTSFSSSRSALFLNGKSRPVSSLNLATGE
jgi:hypothetical protein